MQSFVGHQLRATETADVRTNWIVVEMNLRIEAAVRIGRIRLGGDLEIAVLVAVLANDRLVYEHGERFVDHSFVLIANGTMVGITLRANAMSWQPCDCLPENSGGNGFCEYEMPSTLNGAPQFIILR